MVTTDHVGSLVNAKRVASRKADREQRQREAIERSRMLRYHTQGEWPLDATTLMPADLEPGDVCMPSPPDPPPIEHYKAQAAEIALADEVPDPNLVIARHYARQREIALIEALRGPIWTTDIVDARLCHAFQVSLTWRRGGPRAFGTMMPKALSELSDLVAQAQNQELRKAMSRLLRKRVHWTAKDEQRAAEAIGWTADYLSGSIDWQVPAFVNLGGLWRATRMQVRKACDEIGIATSVFYRKRKSGLQAIADGLTRDRRAPI